MGNTKEQDKMIEVLRKQVLLHDGLGEKHVAGYEYKLFEVTYSDVAKIVFLRTEVGMKGDEGTMAAILARKHRHFAIGVKGGVELLNAISRSKTGKVKDIKVSGYPKVLWALTR
jgi:hypothetical protein